MIAHDIIFHEPQVFNVEVEGVICHAIVLPPSLPYFDVEMDSLISSEEAYGGELRPSFLRLTGRKPEGVPYVAVLTGGYLDPLPVEDMRTPESAVMFLELGGGDFESAVDLETGSHEISLSFGVSADVGADIDPTPERFVVKTVAPVTVETVIGPAGAEVFRLITGASGGEQKVVMIDLGIPAWGAELKSSSLGLVNEIQAAVQHRLRLVTGEGDTAGPYLWYYDPWYLSEMDGYALHWLDTYEESNRTVYLTANETLHLAAQRIDVDISAVTKPAVSWIQLGSSMPEAIETSRSIPPAESIMRLQTGAETEPYLRNYDPQRLSDLDGNSIDWLGIPGERLDLSVIFQGGFTAHLVTSADLEIAP